MNSAKVKKENSSIQRSGPTEIVSMPLAPSDSARSFIHGTTWNKPNKIPTEKKKRGSGGNKHRESRAFLVSNYLRLQACTRRTRLSRSVFAEDARLPSDKTFFRRSCVLGAGESTAPVFSACLLTIKTDSSGRFLRLPAKYMIK